MDQLLQNEQLLLLLCNCSTKLKSAVIKHCEDSLILALTVAVIALLNRQITVDAGEQSLFSYYSKELHQLADVCESIEDKRKVLLKKRFLDVLSPLVRVVLRELDSGNLE